jgi:Hint domain
MTHPGSLRPIAFLVLGAALALGGCSGGATAPAPSASVARLGAAQLRLSLIDQLGPRWYCDPDEFPVARADEQQRALERFPDMQAEGDVFRAVAARLGVDPGGPLGAAQKLAIYQVWKVATSIPFEPRSDGGFAFDYVARPATGQTAGIHTVGTIDPTGAITIIRQDAASQPVCPICLAIGTPIETPNGPVAVERLRLGDAVWTLDAGGSRIPATVIAIGSTPAPRGHLVVRLVLADGRTVMASPGHPTPDQRSLGELRPGDALDGSIVASTELIADPGPDTHDIAVSGPTGIYLAGGIPLRSTLEVAPGLRP